MPVRQSEEIRAGYGPDTAFRLGPPPWKRPPFEVQGKVPFRDLRKIVTHICVALVISGAVCSLHPQAPVSAEQPSEIHTVVGRSLVLEHPDDIVRVSVANPEILDAVAVSTREVVLNGKSAGSTTLIVWGRGGDRQLFTVTVKVNAEPIAREIQESFPGEQVEVHAGKDSITLMGQVSSPAVAERIGALAAATAKTVVNGLRVAPGVAEKQILLRVRFAEIDRSMLRELGFNLFSTGAANTPGAVGTQQFGPVGAGGGVSGVIGRPLSGVATTFTLNDVLNIFAFRPDLNLGVLIKDLETRSLLQILAEPNLVTSNGREATFLAGGEFPFPVVQGGSNAGAVTVQFREFGVRVSFLPLLTDHGTIRMHVRPEVSSLDFSNALQLSGFTIPAISTRRVEADVELERGQSFAIAGLLDQRVTETLSKIPGLASIPVLGNFFKSRSTKKTDSELLVVVTPELAGPGVEIQPGAIGMSQPFMPLSSSSEKSSEKP